MFRSKLNTKCGFLSQFFSFPVIRHHFAPHWIIHFWCAQQICWTIPASCVSLYYVSFVFSSLSFSSSSSRRTYSSSHYPFGLLSVCLLIVSPLPPSPPHSDLGFFFFPASLFSFTDSQRSLPLSFALSPLYKDSHWWTWTFCPGHILLLILLHAMRGGDQLKSVCALVLLSVRLHLDSLGSLIKTLHFLSSSLSFFSTCSSMYWCHSICQVFLSWLWVSFIFLLLKSPLSPLPVMQLFCSNKAALSTIVFMPQVRRAECACSCTLVPVCTHLRIYTSDTEIPSAFVISAWRIVVCCRSVSINVFGAPPNFVLSPCVQYWWIIYLLQVSTFLQAQGNYGIPVICLFLSLPVLNHRLSSPVSLVSSCGTM